MVSRQNWWQGWQFRSLPYPTAKRPSSQKQLYGLEITIKFRVGSETYAQLQRNWCLSSSWACVLHFELFRDFRTQITVQKVFTVKAEVTCDDNDIITSLLLLFTVPISLRRPSVQWSGQDRRWWMVPRPQQRPQRWSRQCRSDLTLCRVERNTLYRLTDSCDDVSWNPCSAQIYQLSSASLDLGLSDLYQVAGKEVYVQVSRDICRRCQKGRNATTAPGSVHHCPKSKLNFSRRPPGTCSARSSCYADCSTLCKASLVDRWWWVMTSVVLCTLGRWNGGGYNELMGWHLVPVPSFASRSSRHTVILLKFSMNSSS